MASLPSIEDLPILPDELRALLTLTLTALSSLADALAAFCLRNWELLAGSALAGVLLLGGVCVIWVVHRVVLGCDGDEPDLEQEGGVRMVERRARAGESPYTIVPVLITHCEDMDIEEGHPLEALHSLGILVRGEDDASDDDEDAAYLHHLRMSKGRGTDRGPRGVSP